MATLNDEIKELKELIGTAYDALIGICPNRAGEAQAKDNGLIALEALTQRVTKHERYEMALRAIAALWPEPPDCAEILLVSGINDGRSRALIADEAIRIARKAIGRPCEEYSDARMGRHGE
jgi:hypothetical protein